MPAGRTITEDERGLLRGVLASPEDVTARLVYADWLDEHDDLRGPWLRAVCEGRDSDDLRAGVDPDWAALFDGRDHFTVLLPTADVHRLCNALPAKQTLRKLSARSSVMSSFRLAKTKPGDHVYPIQLLDGRLHVLTRFRVAAIHSGYVHAADGGLLNQDRVLPRPVLERLRYQHRRGERGLSSLKDGRLTNVTTVHGVFKLTPDSARDFGLVVFAPELLDGFIPLPTPPSGKKRT